MVFQEHQSICAGRSREKGPVIVGPLLFEGRKKRSQMEVSLYAQALEYLQRELLQLWHLNGQSELYRYKQSTINLSGTSSLL